QIVQVAGRRPTDWVNESTESRLFHGSADTPSASWRLLAAEAGWSLMPTVANTTATSVATSSLVILETITNKTPRCVGPTARVRRCELAECLRGGQARQWYRSGADWSSPKGLSGLV